MNISQLTGHLTVDAISQLMFEGNIVPHSWYKHIRYENKRGTYTDHLACLILADIVYWYRPSALRDETTGESIGWKKKFAGELLQRNPEAFAELLGATPKQIRESMKLLEDLNLISIQLRPVHSGFGTIPNSMFIDLNADKIADISYRSTKAQPATNNQDRAETIEKSLLPISVTRHDEMGNTSCRNGEHVMTKSATRHAEMGNSSIYRDYTETNSEITSENSPLTPQKVEQQTGALEKQFQRKVLPIYRTGWKRAEIKPQFLDWLRKVHLPSTQYYKERGYPIDLEDAITWVDRREKTNCSEEIEGKFTQMLKNKDVPNDPQRQKLHDTYSYYAQALGVDQ